MSDGFIREQVPNLIDIPRLYMSDGFIREQVPYLIDIFHDFTCLMASSENRSLI